MSKYILTPLALEVEIRQWAVQRGLNTKIHLAVDAHGMPVRFFITSGTTADCTIAAQLIEGFQAEYLLADRGYDTDAILLKAVDEGMTPVIPPRKKP